MITAGIDIGSTTSKAVILEEDTILGQVVQPSRILPSESAHEVFEKCCTANGIESSQVTAVAVTGYGRRLAKFGDLVITEIRACGLGAKLVDSPMGKIHTIIDVGGQDTKIISLTDDGNVEEFAMNDKCAAGTGRFLEMLANKLELNYEEFVKAALQSDTMIQMNSTCTVFAESEVISLLARGIDKNDIAAAVHNAIADRIGSMARRVGQKEVVCFTGGGARNLALTKALEGNLDKKLFIPESPQTMIALGAALAAREKLKKRGIT